MTRPTLVMAHTFMRVWSSREVGLESRMLGQIERGELFVLLEEVAEGAEGEDVTSVAILSSCSGPGWVRVFRGGERWKVV